MPSRNWPRLVELAMVKASVAGTAPVTVPPELSGATLMVPRIVGWIWQTNGYAPGASNRHVVTQGARAGGAGYPLVAPSAGVHSVGFGVPGNATLCRVVAGFPVT